VVAWAATDEGVRGPGSRGPRGDLGDRDGWARGTSFGDRHVALQQANGAVLVAPPGQRHVQRRWLRQANARARPDRRRHQTAGVAAVGRGRWSVEACGDRDVIQSLTHDRLGDLARCHRTPIVGAAAAPHNRAATLNFIGIGAAARLLWGSGSTTDRLRIAARHGRRFVRLAAAKRPAAGVTVLGMRTLATWCHDRRRTVLGLWVGAFVLLGVLWGTAAGEYVNNFRLPGTESQRAYDLLKDRFPQQSGDTATVVFAVDQGRVLEPGHRPQIERALAEIKKSPEVLGVGDPFAKGAPVSRDGRITFAQIQFRKGSGEVDPAKVKTMAENTLALDGKGGVQVALGGDVIHWSTAQQGGAGEIIGILVAAAVLFLTLGAVAMFLPLLNALFAMIVSLALMAVIGTQLLDVVDWTPQLAAMIGIGVGIDYALLLLNRFRLERGAGRDVREATLIAMDTSGRAVLFAGIVVVIAMLGMMLLGISFLYGPAIGAALAVLCTMLAALTLMPAIMGSRIGRRIKPAGNGKSGDPDLADRETGFAARWSGFVARRPLPVAILALVVLVALALPALHMRLATSDASTYKKSDTTRVAYDLLKEGFGPGFNAPLLLAIELPKGSDQAALQKIGDALGKQDGIAQVLPAQLNQQGDTATMIAYPATTPQDERTDEVVRQARDVTLPPIEQQTGARVSIGGATATNLDFAQTIRDKLPLFIGVVVGLSLLLLAVVFRSLLIPVKAGVFNLLSITGAFGVVTLIFQDGHGAGLFGGATGPIESFLPIMVFAVVFGLSMDYEVFLVSRMHEEWVHTRDAHYAARHGLAMTGRVVTAAAIIMIAVFGAFAIGNERALAMMGVGFAAAIFIDAFIIRLLLLPAVMHLAGPAMWWIPGWLDRRLPHLNIERPDSHEPPTSARPGEPRPQPASG
jgi:RND superfamily putative drug exporter